MVPEVRVERVELLPGGRAAMVLQRKGLLVLKVSAQEITDRGASALMRLMQTEIDSGRLKQDWPGDGAPGQLRDQP